MIRARSSVAEADALGQRIAGALAEYAGTRSAVAEMTTTLCVLAFGALTFRALTPGMMSVAPGVHRRRLGRLLDTLEVDCLGRGDRPFVAREHVFARMLDLWDAVASALLMFRN